jgi:hypothetical protein
MVNQDPQPELYTTIHDFPIAVAAGTQNTVNIFTNQANNEELRIYAVAVDVVLLDAAGNQITAVTDPKFSMPTDFTLTCSVGSNNVPSNAFDLGWIYGQQDQTMSFTVPVLALFQQPLQLTVTANSGVAAFNYGIGPVAIATVRYKISLISELAIQKIAARSM